jgi:hypothetical protein
MTKQTARARVERRMGRPPKDIRDDPDRIKIEFAMALQKAWGLSERKAFDFVVARFEALATEPTKTPRGAHKHPGAQIVGYETRPFRTVSGRSSVLRRKSKRRALRPDVVSALTLALHCRDMDAARRLFEGLSMLATVAGPDRLQRVLTELLPKSPTF